MLRPRAVALAFLISMSSAAPGHEAVTVLTPEEAAKLEPGATVTVRGVLKNAGTNYFTDQRLVITGANGGEPLNVRPWLASTIGTQPRRSGEPTPPAQSQFLDQEVVLKGRMEIQSVKGSEPTKILIVEQADILKR